MHGAVLSFCSGISKNNKDITLSRLCYIHNFLPRHNSVVVTESSRIEAHMFLNTFQTVYHPRRHAWISVMLTVMSLKSNVTRCQWQWQQDHITCGVIPAES